MRLLVITREDILNVVNFVNLSPTENELYAAVMLGNELIFFNEILFEGLSVNSDIYYVSDQGLDISYISNVFKHNLSGLGIKEEDLYISVMDVDCLGVIPNIHRPGSFNHYSDFGIQESGVFKEWVHDHIHEALEYDDEHNGMFRKDGLACWFTYYDIGGLIEKLETVCMTLVRYMIAGIYTQGRLPQPGEKIIYSPNVIGDRIVVAIL